MKLHELIDEESQNNNDVDSVSRYLDDLSVVSAAGTVRMRQLVNTMEFNWFTAQEWLSQVRLYDTRRSSECSQGSAAETQTS